MRHQSVRPAPHVLNATGPKHDDQEKCNRTRGQKRSEASEELCDESKFYACLEPPWQQAAKNYPTATTHLNQPARPSWNINTYYSSITVNIGSGISLFKLSISCRMYTRKKWILPRQLVLPIVPQRRNFVVSNSRRRRAPSS